MKCGLFKLLLSVHTHNHSFIANDVCLLEEIAVIDDTDVDVDDDAAAAAAVAAVTL